MNRRSFLFGAGAGLIAAPAIVRAATIMPVRAIVMEDTEQLVIPQSLTGRYMIASAGNGCRWVHSQPMLFNTGDEIGVAILNNDDDITSITLTVNGQPVSGRAFTASHLNDFGCEDYELAIPSL